MNKNENSRSCINVYTASISNGLKVSSADIKQVISATNNRAQYYAEQSKKYRDEAKEHRDNAKYYAEQNSDVTFDYINSVQSNLEQKIATKQPVGDYALKEEIPINVSELVNDANYVNNITFENSINEVRLPKQLENGGKYLKTDGKNPYWASVNAFNLFDTKLSDKILTYEESQGWELQGTYVYKEAIAGSRYGYPDFYNKVVEEFNEATNTETVNGVAVKVHSNGHKFYDIADKTAIDNYFNSMGSAWFYGVDTENERVFLPRNNWFEQATLNESEVGQSVQAGLPQHTHSYTIRSGTNSVDWNSSRSGLCSISNVNANAVIADQFGYGSNASNSTYGNSNTVQPKSVKKLLYICVGNTTNYEGVTDVVNQGMEILEQVAQKVNVDGTNLNAEGKSLISGYALPSDKVVDLTLGATGTLYTAPANGWVIVELSCSYLAELSINAYYGSSYIAYNTSNPWNGNYPLRLSIPVAKGKTFRIWYTNLVTKSRFQFIYAEGEK